ncbi:Uncharacterized protein APZ42_005908, partial [Daphnia magna]
RPGGQREDVGRQHADLGRRAQHGRDAVDAQHDDEGQQHAGNDGGRDQREGDREHGPQRAGARHLGRLLQRGVHVLQGRDDEEVDIGGVVHAEDQDHPGHAVEVDPEIEPHLLEEGVEKPG